MNTKQLHKHASPIIILSVGILFASVAGLSSLMIAGSHSDNSLTQLLSERLLNIQPAKNGLFHISRYQSGGQANSRLLTNHNISTGLGAISDTGEGTVLDTTLNSISGPAQ